MKLLDTCENHHGPVTQESILLVDTLKEKELISDIGYLRATVAPDITQMREWRLTENSKWSFRVMNSDSQSRMLLNQSQTYNDIDALLKQYI